jgi:hypothetical protein
VVQQTAHIVAKGGKMASTTPEGAVKKILSDYLISIGCIQASHASEATFANTGWFFWPVPTGFGVAGIADVIGHYKGRFFSLEVKAPGRNDQKNRGMSPAQKHHLDAILKSGGYAYVFDGSDEDVKALKDWIGDIDERLSSLRDGGAVGIDKKETE